MKDHIFSELLILRSPAGSAVDFTLNTNEILNNKTFLSALAIASPQFYSHIRKGALDEGAKLSLRRYYNRFCFRPTPFGLFASITPMSWDGMYDDLPDQKTLFVQLDNHFEYFLKHVIKQGHVILEPNPTLYQVSRDLRFIRTDTDPVTGKRLYLLQETDRTPLLQRILSYCDGGRDQKDILGSIIKLSDNLPEESERYLMFLVDAQVLVPRDRPVISGLFDPDLFSRDPEKVHHMTGRSVIFDERILQDLQRSAYAIDLPGSLGRHGPLNVISVGDRPTSIVTKDHRQSLQDGLFALEVLNQSHTDGPLADLIAKFKRHFDGQIVPLLELLDPEIGIGYGPVDEQKIDPLLETIVVAVRRDERPVINWTKVHQLILDLWHGPGYEAEKQITLTEKDLYAVSGKVHNKRHSGLSVLFRANTEMVWLESAGGYHPNSLLGRFTPASSRIFHAAKAMAVGEQQLDPDIIFAEILHLSDLRRDNVNRRRPILDWEIPLSAASGRPRNQQIELKDLYVQLVNGKLLLSSKKNRKFVMPRLSSAYNHQLDRLPLFRFLADIPHQFGSNIRTLDLRVMFPGLRSYPRVVYKNTILALARWVLNKEDIRSLKADPGHFALLKKALLLPDRFLLTQGDQQLFFDIGSDEELSFFISCIGRSEQVDLQEAFLETTTGNIVRAQYNAFILSEGSLGFPALAADRTDVKSSKRQFMPGSEWLYLKIYTSRSGAVPILRQLSPYVRKERRAGTIIKWFFVRYEDHAPHIRVRLLLDAKQIGRILAHIRMLFERHVERRVIREFQVDTYTRELERYGAGNIEQVEDFFHASSELILKYLTSSNADTQEPHLFALSTTKTLVDIAFPQITDRIAYYQRRYDEFSREFKGEKQYVELDKRYRTLRASIAVALSDRTYFRKIRLQKQQNVCSKIFRNLTTQAEPVNVQATLLIDSLIHMHLNRIFMTDGRKQEMIVFYFLEKYSKSLLHLENHDQ